jgi:uncharacterized metal-binding protein
MQSHRGKITHWLERSPTAVTGGYAVSTAFLVYFCVYAFRKPFAAATYSDLQFGGPKIQIQLKTALVVSWLLGYTVSKYLGTKVVTESHRAVRMWMLVGLVAASELALILFAIAPNDLKVAAMFLNGLPLGFVFGLVVRYLEGRRTSDILLAGLACSFIIANGVFMDVGRALLQGDVIRLIGVPIPNPFPPLSEFWMPAAAGALFFPAFLVVVWLLNQLPEPTATDIAARTEREPMDGARRRQFLLAYLPGLLPLFIAYVFLTVFRDYRGNYMVDILNELGYQYKQNPSIMTHIELGVAVGVFLSMGLIYRIKDNRRGLLAILAAVAAGFITIGVATLLHMAGTITGFWWIALTGFGAYLAYVPYNSVLFDRLMASTRFVGTAVFCIYVADSAGYTASCIIQLGKDLLAANTTRTAFLQYFSLALSVVGTISILAGTQYFWRREQAQASDEPRTY